MLLLYTWQDVEMLFNKAFPYGWHEKWSKIDVYLDEVVINVTSDFSISDNHTSSEKLKEIFGARFLTNENRIILDYNNKSLVVTYENSEASNRKLSPLPLFKEYLKEVPPLNRLIGVPVIAFHSYKGGVGRTLSLMATVRSLSAIKKDKYNPYKLLIVDGDFEAPGLTWLALENKSLSDISLLDSLALIQSENNWEETVPFIANKIKETTIRIPTGEFETEHYFLPAYRDEYQLLSMPTTPEKLVMGIGKEYVISDFLSELGKQLNVDAVLVDQRAGISEFAAPLLFDPRVRKVYVTSTSLQSRCGIKTLFREIYRNPISNDLPDPTVFISMVPDELDENERDRIQLEMLEGFNALTSDDDNDFLSMGIKVYFLPFSNNLIHLDGFESINKRLTGTPMLKEIDKVVANWFPINSNYNHSDLSKQQRNIFLESLIKMTSTRIVAESNLISDFLTTIPLKNLARKFTYGIPILVIPGAKGSGKTFTYLQMLRSGTWENFVARILKDSDSKSQTYIIPLLKSKNISALDSEISSGLENINKSLGFKLSLRNLEERYDEIELFIKGKESDTETNWKNFWKKELLQSTGLGFENFDQLQSYLDQNNKRILFVIDGLEEIFLKISTDNAEKTGVRALCQGLINELRTYPNGRIGLVVFIRRDIAMNAIEQNWSQFAAQYEAYELKWTHTEAIRLVLWLVSQIESKFILNDINIENATHEAIEEKLRGLWGLKLGRPDSNEAFSANWILAALSDFNRQLQARDIIRFLLNAAKDTKDTKTAIYEDRYLAPSAIKKAIPPCSQEKIQEIEQEMRNIQPIFEKLKSKPLNQKQIPFQLEDYELTKAEASILEQQGFFKKLDDGCYMPEIIRHGLGFRLPKGARPKVLTLLKSN